MAAYLVAQIKVTRHEGWSDYRTKVGPLAERFGGRYLVRAADVQVLEGSHDRRRLVVFEFSSMEAIDRFWNSPEYAELKKLRQGSAELDVWAVPGAEGRP